MSVEKIDLQAMMEAKESHKEAFVKAFHAMERVKEAFNQKRLITKTINHSYLTRGRDIPVLFSINTYFGEERQCIFERTEEELSEPRELRKHVCNDHAIKCPLVPTMRIYVEGQVVDEKDINDFRIERYVERYGNKLKPSGPFRAHRDRCPKFEVPDHKDSPKERELRTLRNIAVLETQEEWEKENSFFEPVDLMSQWIQAYIFNELFVECFSPEYIKNFRRITWCACSYYASIRDCLGLPKLEQYKDYLTMNDDLRNKLEYNQEITEHGEISYVRNPLLY